MKSETKIILPHDAEGREIPLDTKVLYDDDGEKIEVSRYQYYPYVGSGYWNLTSVRHKYYREDKVHIAPPDSWEKLLDDLDHASKGGDNAECLYMRRDGMEVQCPGCRLEDVESDDIACSYLAYADIAARIRKLRGEGE